MITTTWTEDSSTTYQIYLGFNQPGHLHSENREGKMHRVNISRWTKEGDEPVDGYHGNSLCHRFRQRTFKICLLAHKDEYSWCKDCVRIMSR